MAEPIFIPPSTLVWIVDWSMQGLFLLLTFVHPWFLGPGRGVRAFTRPLVVGFLWGMWRVGYYDWTTHNDIPGMGYFFGAFIAGIYALVFYAIRSVLVRWWAGRRESRNA